MMGTGSPPFTVSGTRRVIPVAVTALGPAGSCPVGALPWALVTPGGLMTHLPFASRNLSPARGLGRGDNRVRALRAARAQGRCPGSQLVAGHPGQALPQLPGGG